MVTDMNFWFWNADDSLIHATMGYQSIAMRVGINASFVRKPDTESGRSLDFAEFSKFSRGIYFVS